MGGVTVRDVDVSCHPSLSVTCCFRCNRDGHATMDLDPEYGISWQWQQTETAARNETGSRSDLSDRYNTLGLG